MDDPRVKALNEAFLQTLNPNPAVIKQAEAGLRDFSKQNNHALSLLKLVSCDTAIEIRQAAAVNFKNFVKRHWVPDEETDTQIPDTEKEQIKSLIIRLMLSTPGPVQAQLSEALTVIGSFDFPANWKGLLPELLENMRSPNANVVAGILETANSIFKRYRNQMMSAELSQELQYAQQMVQPLLQTLQRLVKEVAGATDSQTLKHLLTSCRLALRVFFSLNSPGLTEEFENTLDAWMSEFHALLTYENAAVAEMGGDRGSPLVAVKAAVCQNINLLVNRDEEEFGKFLETFVRDVWTELVKVGTQPNQEQLAMSAIQFLTTVSKSPRNAALFQNQQALEQICEKIIVPNLQLNEDLEEMFEMNYVEYVRRDTEGSDFDTRRRAATELVKALLAQFPNEVTQLFTKYVQHLLAEAGSNRGAKWKSKDTAMYLVTALAVTGKTASQGATSTNQLFNITDFFQTQVMPELQAAGGQAQAVLQADALKFTTIFRSQLSREGLLAVLPLLAPLLASESNVVHSYAAILLDRLLTSKVDRQPRFAVAELKPFLEGLLGPLFAAFRLPDSAENEYVMKCVMRVISFVGPEIAPVAPQCLQELSGLLLEVCKNPTVPGFNHFLFESVAALIANTAASKSDTVVTLENMLFPPFQLVLSNDVVEFHPYVFQIFSQLIELRPRPLPASYMQLFGPLLSPLLWERGGNVPALTRLVRAYLAKASDEIIQQNQLVGILGVFQKLIASKAQDHEGFKLLQSLMEFAPEAALSQYTAEVYRILFSRLQSAKTSKYVAGLLGFLSWMVCKQGVSAVESSIDGVQPGLFRMLLEQVWLPNMGSIKAYDQQKLLAVAMTKVLCECPSIQNPNSAGVWGQLLQKLIAIVDGEAPANELGGEDENEEADFGGYSAAFAKLHNAALKEPDSLLNGQDPIRFLAESLSQLSRRQPGTVQQLIQAQIPPEGQQKLQMYCQQTGVSIA